MRGWLFLVLAACSGAGIPEGPPDARLLEPFESCSVLEHTLSCVDGRVTDVVRWTRAPGSNLVYCNRPQTITSYSCIEGCAVEGLLLAPTKRLVDSPYAFCRETMTPSTCRYEDIGGPCIPTRAVANPDGSVTQTYLACTAVGPNGCQPSAAPTISGYLTACAPSQITSRAVPGQDGIVAIDDDSSRSNACLVVWDAQGTAFSSGRTTRCLGDWQCPAGSLCDDQLPLVNDARGPVAVCKPGPRGVLTAAMFVPPPQSP